MLRLCHLIMAGGVKRRKSHGGKKLKRRAETGRDERTEESRVT